MDKEILQRLLWEPSKNAALKSGLRPELWDVARLDLSSRGALRLNEGFDVVDSAGATIDLEEFFKTAYRAERSRYYAPAEKPKASDGKTMTRAAFDALNPMEKFTYIKEGGALTD